MRHAARVCYGWINLRSTSRIQSLCSRSTRVGACWQRKRFKDNIEEIETFNLKVVAIRAASDKSKAFVELMTLNGLSSEMLHSWQGSHGNWTTARGAGAHIFDLQGGGGNITRLCGRSMYGRLEDFMSFQGFKASVLPFLPYHAWFSPRAEEPKSPLLRKVLKTRHSLWVHVSPDIQHVASFWFLGRPHSWAVCVRESLVQNSVSCSPSGTTLRWFGRASGAAEPGEG